MYRSLRSYIMLPPMNLSIVRLLPNGSCGNYHCPPNIHSSCIGPCRLHAGLYVANRTRRSEPRPEAERRATTPRPEVERRETRETTDGWSPGADNLLRCGLHLGSRTGYLSGIYSAHRRVQPYKPFETSHQQQNCNGWQLFV